MDFFNAFILFVVIAWSILRCFTTRVFTHPQSRTLLTPRLCPVGCNCGIISNLRSVKFLQTAFAGFSLKVSLCLAMRPDIPWAIPDASTRYAFGLLGSHFCRNCFTLCVVLYLGSLMAVSLSQPVSHKCSGLVAGFEEPCRLPRLEGVSQKRKLRVVPLFRCTALSSRRRLSLFCWI